MQFEDLGLSKDPFAEQPDIELFFPEAGRTTLLRRMYADLQKGSTVLRIIGAEGTGKTMLCQMLVHLLPDEFQPVFLAEPGGSFAELCQNIFVQLNNGEPDQEKLPDLPTLAEQYQQQGKHLLLLIDQADKMFPAALERLSRIAFAAQGSPSFFQVILAGRPALNEQINQLTSYCADITIPDGYTVAPLTEEEIGAYLNFRLKAASLSAAVVEQAFSQEAVQKIFSQTQGNLQQSNKLAARSLQKLCEEKRPFPVQKTDIPLLTKEAGRITKQENRSSRFITWSALTALLLFFVLLFHYNSALWQNGVAQIQHLLNFGTEGPKKLLPLPKELQLNSEEELPPSTAEQEFPPETEEDTVAPETQETQHDKTATDQSDAAELPVSEEKPFAPEEKQNQVVRSQEEQTPENMPKAEKIVAPTLIETTEEADVQENQESSQAQVDEEVASEEPLETPPKDQRTERPEEEQKDAEAIQELTPVAQKKIVQLIPGMKKTKVSSSPSPALPQTEKKNQPEQQPTTTQAVPEQQVPVIDLPHPVTEPTPDANMLYQELHFAGSRLRTSLNANKYTLQLLVLSSPDASDKIKEMIVRDEYLDHKQQLKILRKQTLPTALFIFYGLYNSADEARRALDALPLFLRKHHPYVLSVKEALKKTAYL